MKGSGQKWFLVVAGLMVFAGIGALSACGDEEESNVGSSSCPADCEQGSELTCPSQMLHPVDRYSANAFCIDKFEQDRASYDAAVSTCEARGYSLCTSSQLAKAYEEGNGDFMSFDSGCTQSQDYGCCNSLWTLAEFQCCPCGNTPGVDDGPVVFNPDRWPSKPDMSYPECCFETQPYRCCWTP